jgi:hypothetical protein
MILQSFSPKQSGNFGGTSLKFSIVLLFRTYFRKQFLKTELKHFHRPIKNNGLEYFRTIFMQGIFQMLLDEGILLGTSKRQMNSSCYLLKSPNFSATSIMNSA